MIPAQYLYQKRNNIENNGISLLIQILNNRGFAEIIRILGSMARNLFACSFIFGSGYNRRLAKRSGPLEKRRRRKQIRRRWTPSHD